MLKTQALFRPLAVVQGLYYITTGIWSLVSPGSFQGVTGPKKDY